LSVTDRLAGQSVNLQFVLRVGAEKGFTLADER
jgi:hypothetical protein